MRVLLFTLQLQMAFMVTSGQRVCMNMSPFFSLSGQFKALKAPLKFHSVIKYYNRSKQNEFSVNWKDLFHG